MPRSLKLGGAVLGGLLLLLVVAVGSVYAVSESRLARDWDVEPAPLSIPTDSASLAWGRHLAETRGCTDCHAEDFGGMLFADAPPVFRLYGSNLTSGEGGVAGEYGDADWVRAIRHGVGPDGKALLFMPSYEFQHYSDDDVAALVAYLKTLPPVDRVPPVTNAVYPVGRLLYLRGQVPLVPAEMVDHARTERPAPERGATEAYGRYMVRSGCVGCHAEDLRGGPIPGTPPDWPPAADISREAMASWTQADFFRALREGLRPDGSVIDPIMPVKNTARLTDDEILALWLYLSGREAEGAPAAAAEADEG